jgi:endoglucanase
MFPHHRPSVADGVIAPVPGMLVGGPNEYSAGECVYQYSLPALEYTDQTCSYSTNEIAINWNAPLAFALGAIEAKHKGIEPSYKYFAKGYPMSVSSKLSNSTLSLYPNPAMGFITIQANSNDDFSLVEFYNPLGLKVYATHFQNTIDISDLENGVYVVKVTGSKGVYSNKITISKQ